METSTLSTTTTGFQDYRGIKTDVANMGRSTFREQSLMYPADFGLPRVPPVGGNLQLVSNRLAFSHQENLQFAQAFPAKQVHHSWHDKLLTLCSIILVLVFVT